MKFFKCGGKENPQQITAWQKVAGKISQAKETIKEKGQDFLETKTGGIVATSAMTVAAMGGVAAGEMIRRTGFAFADAQFLGGAVSMGGGALEASSAVVALVGGAILTHEASQTKIGKAFINGCKNTARKMNDFTRAKIIPFAKNAQQQIEQKSNKYFGSKDENGVFMDIYKGEEYVGTLTGDGKPVNQPLKTASNVLKQTFRATKLAQR